mgnify:FL=1|jgi:hypothetical protein
MEVFSLGNVTECNYGWIFLNTEGKQERIKADKDRLKLILDTAGEDMRFYERMGNVVTQFYERRKAEVEKKYHFITDEMVKAAYKESSDRGFELSITKDSNNEECIRQYAAVHGLYGGASLAHDRYWEARKLLEQAKNALKQYI